MGELVWLIGFVCWLGELVWLIWFVGWLGELVRLNVFVLGELVWLGFVYWVGCLVGFGGWGSLLAGRVLSVTVVLWYADFLDQLSCVHHFEVRRLVWLVMFC